MAERYEALSTVYTPEERENLEREFSEVLTHCTDYELGVVLAAAARALHDEVCGYVEPSI